MATKKSTAVGMVKAVQAVVHHEKDPESAYKVFEKEKPK